MNTILYYVCFSGIFGEFFLHELQEATVRGGLTVKLMVLSSPRCDISMADVLRSSCFLELKLCSSSTVSVAMAITPLCESGGNYGMRHATVVIFLQFKIFLLDLRITLKLHLSGVGRAPLHSSVKTSTRHFHWGRKLQFRQ